MYDAHHLLQVSTVKHAKLPWVPYCSRSASEEVQAPCSKKWPLPVKGVATRERKGRWIQAPNPNLCFCGKTDSGNIEVLFKN